MKLVVWGKFLYISWFHFMLERILFERTISLLNWVHWHWIGFSWQWIFAKSGGMLFAAHWNLNFLLLSLLHLIFDWNLFKTQCRDWIPQLYYLFYGFWNVDYVEMSKWIYTFYFIWSLRVYIKLDVIYYVSSYFYFSWFWEIYYCFHFPKYRVSIDWDFGGEIERSQLGLLLILFLGLN